MQGDVSDPLEGLPTRSQLLTLPMVVVALTAANTGTQENLLFASFVILTCLCFKGFYNKPIGCCSVINWLIPDPLRQDSDSKLPILT